MCCVYHLFGVKFTCMPGRVHVSHSHIITTASRVNTWSTQLQSMCWQPSPNCFCPCACPCAPTNHTTRHYRKRLITSLPELNFLDEAAVSDRDRRLAAAFIRVRGGGSEGLVEEWLAWGGWG